MPSTLLDDRDEEQIYAALAKSVDGPLLRELTVEHWGHIHARTNEYRANWTVQPAR